MMTYPATSFTGACNADLADGGGSESTVWDTWAAGFHGFTILTIVYICRFDSILWGWVTKKPISRASYPLSRSRGLQTWELGLAHG